MGRREVVTVCVPPSRLFGDHMLSPCSAGFTVARGESLPEGRLSGIRNLRHVAVPSGCLFFFAFVGGGTLPI